MPLSIALKIFCILCFRSALHACFEKIPAPASVAFLDLWLYTKQSPPVYILTNDTANYERLPDRCLQVLKDKEGKWTTAHVSAPALVNNFQAYNSAKGIDYSVHTIWLRYRLRNTLNRDVNKGFYDQGNPFCEENERTDYNLQYGDGYQQHVAGGWATPWKRKKGLYYEVSTHPLHFLYFTCVV